MDFEQASRNGDKVWDVAEFLYYTGHYVSPFVGVRQTQLIAEAFIEGYVGAGGNVKIIKEAGSPKYTRFSAYLPSSHNIRYFQHLQKSKKIGQSRSGKPWLRMKQP